MGVRLVDGVLVTDEEAGISLEEVPDPIVTEKDADDLRCEECGTVLFYSGRGRHPKRCDDCKTTAPRRSGSTPRRSGVIKNEAALRDALLSRYMQIGSLMAMIHPAYGMSVKQKAEEAVNADIEYARVSPAFRRTLESMLEKTALGAVIAVHASMLAPVVVGERSKAMRKKAARQSETVASATTTPKPASPPRSAPRPPEGSVVYGDFPSTESDVAPEVVNAAAMPGMPG